MPDLAVVRLRNTQGLFNEFARSTVSGAASEDVRGLDKLFAERLRISPSYWSQLKSRERHIGEKLARQFEVLMGKPEGWLDEVHPLVPAAPPPPPTSLPLNDDERFAVSLFLTAYRMNPQAVKSRLLATLEGELAKAEATETVARKRHADAPAENSTRGRLTKIK